jgi:hypothetical protein
MASFEYDSADILSPEAYTRFFVMLATNGSDVSYAERPQLFLALGDLSRLPRVSCTISDASVAVRFPGKRFPRKSFLNAMALLDAGGYLRALLSCDFPERNSKPSRSRSDSLCACYEAGVWELLYNSNGSRVLTERTYAREFFPRLISACGLPIDVEDKDGNFYLLPHGPTKIRITSGGIFGDNPTGFAYPVAARGQELVQLLERGLAAVSTGACYGFHISLDVDPSLRDLDLLREAVATIIQPGTKSKARLTLEGVRPEYFENLRIALGPKESGGGYVGTIILPNGEQAACSVHFDSRGYSISLEAWDAETVPEITRMTAVRFRDCVLVQ